jgi:hypothetical protein
MDSKVQANVDAFAQFLSKLADKYEMEHDDFIAIFRHICKCFGGAEMEDKHERG